MQDTKTFGEKHRRRSQRIKLSRVVPVPDQAGTQSGLQSLGSSEQRPPFSIGMAATAAVSVGVQWGVIESDRVPAWTKWTELMSWKAATETLSC